MSQDHATLVGWLSRLHLTAIRDQLDSLLDEAAQRELPPLRMPGGSNQRIHRLLRRATRTQQRKPAWPEPRIGAMLRQHRADARRAERDTRAHGNGRRGNSSTDLPRAGAAADRREGHLPPMSRPIDDSRPGLAAAPGDGSTASAAGLAQLAVSVVLLSSAWPLTRLAVLAGSTPIWFAEGRSVLCGATAAAILALLGRLRVPSRADLPSLVVIGVFQLGLYFVLAHEAVAWVQAGRTAILANTTTIWVVPLSLLFLRERIPPRRWLAAGLGLAGVAILMSPWSIDWTSRNVLVGHAFLLGAGLSWSVAIVFTRMTPPRLLSSFELLPWCFLLSAAMLLPLMLWHAPDGTFGWRPVSWAALLYIGLLAGPLGTWCIIQATATLPTIVSSIGVLTTPAVSLILANLFLGESFAPDLVAGPALIIAGVGFAAWPRRRA